MFAGRHAKTAAQNAMTRGGSFGVISMDDMAQAIDRRYYYNFMSLANNIWYNQTRANVSTGYDYARDMMFFEFGGRNSARINVTKWDERYYNISVAKQVVINTTLQVKKNFSLFPYNSSGINLNCGIASKNNGSWYMVCNGTKGWSG